MTYKTYETIHAGPLQKYFRDMLEHDGHYHDPVQLVARLVIVEQSHHWWDDKVP